MTTRARGYQDRQAERNGYRQIVVRFPIGLFDKMYKDSVEFEVSFAAIVRMACQCWIEDFDD